MYECVSGAERLNKYLVFAGTEMPCLWGACLDGESRRHIGLIAHEGRGMNTDS